VSPKIALVSPRPPQSDGTGDQRRAQDLVESLDPIAELEVVSWIPPGQAFPLPRSPRALLRLLKLLPGRPLQVAITQASCPAEVNEVVEKADLAVFVTDRAPYGPTLPPNSVIDFIDDLGAVVGRRSAQAAGLSRLFWRLESWRLRSYDRKLVASAAVAVAHADPDAAGLGPGVRAIGLPFRLEPAAPAGDKILFLGNLYYHPNEEAACWICRELVPELEARGIPPQRVLICGRRPGRALTHLARKAGVDFRPDVPNTSTVMAEAALVLCPTTLGTGAITKVIDAVGALRPTVITPLANEGLGLVDGESALVRPRDAGLFADAVEELLGSEDLRISIAKAAYEQLGAFQPGAVHEAWQDVVKDVLRSASAKPHDGSGAI
jgi:hypothetical protein